MTWKTSPWALVACLAIVGAWSTADAHKSSGSHSADDCSCAAELPSDALSPSYFHGPDTPFPWTVSIPFPWSKIEGTWQSSGASIASYFSFEVQTDENGRKVLRVFEMRGDTHAILATGIGIEVDDNMVRAAMTGQSGSYMLFVGAFKNPKFLSSKPVTILTVRSFSSTFESPDVQLVARKISNTPMDPDAN